MKYWLTIILFVILSSACQHRTEQAQLTISPERSSYTLHSGMPLQAHHQGLELQHLNLQIKIIPSQQAIHATATLTMHSQDTMNQLWLDLDDMLPITQIKVNQVSLNKQDYQHAAGQLKITLPRSARQAMPFTVSISYSGHPLIAKQPPWQGGFVWSHTAQGKPWIATAIQGEGCDIFWPCIDHPLFEPQQVDLHISVPEGLVAAANGKLISQQDHNGWTTYHWQSHKSINTYAISLNVGPYQLLQDSYLSHFGNEIDLQYWYLSDQETSIGLFQQFSQFLTFFEQMIGPYPFGEEKMGVVDTPHLGMEHQTINAYGNAHQIDKFGFDWLLHHEFAHEWFGNQLTHSDINHIWLHEGFATYMQALYAQYLYGDAVYFEYLQGYRRKITNQVAVIQTPAPPATALLDIGDAYYKGALFLHTLRSLVGDPIFFKAVRLLVYGTQDPQPGNFQPLFATTQDFINIINQLTTDDYSWLFTAYLSQPQLPKLIMTRQPQAVHFTWQVPNDLPFPMPLSVQVKDRIIKLPMTNMHGVIKVAANTVVIPDPQAKILRDQPFIEAFRQFQQQKSE